MRTVRRCVRFLRHGAVVSLDRFDPRDTLLDYLRITERALGTKEGCAEGDCGACTVVLGRLRNGVVVYEPVNSCILLLGQADGAELVTVEDLPFAGELHPVQREMVEWHGSQCGFCTPGIVMSLFAHYHRAPRPVDRQSVIDALAGNLCRCTGYRPIVAAGLATCAAPPQDRFVRDMGAVAASLAGLRDDQGILVGDRDRFFAAPRCEQELADIYGANPDATLVAGCTDVGVWITKQLADLNKVIWLGRVADLGTITRQEDRIAIGAAVTLAQAHAAFSGIDYDLGELVRRFGSPQIRTAASLGGNIANGSPIGDLAPALIALDATLELRRGDEVRAMPLEQFFVDYRKQNRRSGEFVRRITVPLLQARDRFRCFKVSKRFDEDIAAVLGAFRITVDGRRVESARIAFGGMAGIPKRALAAEAALAGASLDEPRSWDAAVVALADDYRPISDLRASAAYRALIARNLLSKALIELASDGAIATRILGGRQSLPTRS